MARQAQLFGCPALGIEKGSRESIHSSAGPLVATERPQLQAMPPRSTDLSHGPLRPNQEHGAPIWWQTALAVKSSSVSDVRYERLSCGMIPRRPPRKG